MIENFSNMQENIISSKVPENYNFEKGILRTIHNGDFKVNPSCGLYLTYKICSENVLVSPSQTQ